MKQRRARNKNPRPDTRTVWGTAYLLKCEHPHLTTKRAESLVREFVDEFQIARSITDKPEWGGTISREESDNLVEFLDQEIREGRIQ